MTDIPDFSKIWGSNSPLTPYVFTDENYLKGWNFVGSTPPARSMFDAYMRSVDAKLKFLKESSGEYLLLTGGTLTGQLIANGGVQGNLTGNATTATTADSANTLGIINPANVNGDRNNSTFTWGGKAGQPTWLWGGSDPNNMYVYDPSNFNVNHAITAGSATNATNDKNGNDITTTYAPSGYGLGGNAAAVVGVSANTLIKSGFFQTDITCTDVPVTGNRFFITVLGGNDLYDTFQLASGFGDNPLTYERWRYSGTWSAWKELATTDGNVSTATKLAAAKKINNVAFDGSSDITIADSTKLPLTGGTLSGHLIFDDSVEIKLYGANRNCGLSLLNTGIQLYDWANSRNIWKYTQADNTVKCDADAKFSSEVYADGWFRTTGATGWLNETHQGGWYMTDDTWIRVYNGKSVFTAGGVQADGGFTGNLTGNADAANALITIDENGVRHNSNFNWISKVGQPPLLWGGDDVSNMYVYNPSNFDVASVGGYTANSLTRRIAGQNTPTMTALIDWDAMAAANGGISCKNLVNAGTGITAYGGDSSALNNGDIILSQSYQNFDAILVAYTDDSTDMQCTAKIEKWELDYLMSFGYRFNLTKNPTQYWFIYSNANYGTTTHNLSTTTRFYAQSQNGGIIEIYGLTY